MESSVGDKEYSALVSAECEETSFRVEELFAAGVEYVAGDGVFSVGGGEFLAEGGEY